MSRGFSKGRGSDKGRAVVRFSDDELEILRILLFGQLELLDLDDPLGDDPDPLARALGIAPLRTDGPIEPPDDPALARLFPNAYRDDNAEAGEFRRLTEPDLREAKRVNVRSVLDSLAKTEGEEPVVLDADLAAAWLGALNDLRLVLGTRLEIADEQDDLLGRISPDDPRFGAVHLYHWLGLIQETLLGVLPLT